LIFNTPPSAKKRKANVLDTASEQPASKKLATSPELPPVTPATTRSSMSDSEDEMMSGMSGDEGFDFDDGNDSIGEGEVYDDQIQSDPLTAGDNHRF
jgi:hypothetical protein